MKKFIFGLSAIAIIITSIFAFVGCEKEEKSNNTSSTTKSMESTQLNSYSITLLTEFTQMIGVYEIQQTESNDDNNTYRVYHDDVTINNISIPSGVWDININNKANETSISFSHSQIMLCIDNYNEEKSIITNNGIIQYTDDNIELLSSEEQLELLQLIILYDELTNSNQPRNYSTGHSSEENTQYMTSIRLCRSTAKQKANTLADNYVKANPDCKREKEVNVHCCFGDFGCIAIVVVKCK